MSIATRACPPKYVISPLCKSFSNFMQYILFLSSHFCSEAYYAFPSDLWNLGERKLVFLSFFSITQGSWLLSCRQWACFLQRESLGTAWDKALALIHPPRTHQHHTERPDSNLGIVGLLSRPVWNPRLLDPTRPNLGISGAGIFAALHLGLWVAGAELLGTTGRTLSWPARPPAAGSEASALQS